MKKKVLSTVTLYSQRCKSAKELLEKEGFEVIGNIHDKEK